MEKLVKSERATASVDGTGDGTDEQDEGNASDTTSDCDDDVLSDSDEPKDDVGDGAGNVIFNSVCVFYVANSTCFVVCTKQKGKKQNIKRQCVRVQNKPKSTGNTVRAVARRNG